MVFTIQYYTELKEGRPVAGANRLNKTFTFEEETPMSDILSEVETFLRSSLSTNETEAIKKRRELVKALRDIEAQFPNIKDDDGSDRKKEGKE